MEIETVVNSGALEYGIRRELGKADNQYPWHVFHRLGAHKWIRQSAYPTKVDAENACFRYIE